MSTPGEIGFLRGENDNLLNEIERLKYRLDNQAKTIRRLKGEVTRWQKVSEDDDVVLADRAAQLTAATEEIAELHSVIDMGLHENNQQAECMLNWNLRLIDCTNKLTAERTKVEKLREALLLVRTAIDKQLYPSCLAALQQALTDTEDK